MECGSLLLRLKAVCHRIHIYAGQFTYAVVSCLCTAPTMSKHGIAIVRARGERHQILPLPNGHHCRWRTGTLQFGKGEEQSSKVKFIINRDKLWLGLNYAGHVFQTIHLSMVSIVGYNLWDQMSMLFVFQHRLCPVATLVAGNDSHCSKIIR
ncbi:hypothetical protein CPB83DRAFT_236983 [Crepidotus variabilis]|uniref:Uncharacterized protein n=1 Tax=Crepidotus variabilis TaxID=179855 RepID=A0A9P6EJ00_9AGAR|nr:hypothetical protein CPB83DRAFT_236983 [Crepidotus variabilis]